MVFPTFRLDGQIALVTGAGQGIGRSIALGLANAGATVVATDANPERLPEVERALAELGRPGLALTMDVRDPAGIQRAVETTVGTYDRLDILVNNAGVRVQKPALEHTLADWEFVFAVNTTGVFLCTQVAAQVMKERGGGCVISIASHLAQAVAPLRVAYCASKAAVVQMTRALAFEWAPYNIRVNAIGPGSTKTPYTMAALASSGLPGNTAQVPLGRMADPDELVGAVVYLASDAGSFVTGSFVVVDGGLSVAWR